eukprot:m51a1_g5561 hypothetical protein (249) ;mRNA; f:575532-576688
MASSHESLELNRVENCSFPSPEPIKTVAKSKSKRRSRSASVSPVPAAGGFRRLADPGPLGLAAFGTTTFLLNCHNTEALNPAGSLPMIFAMGMFYGGLIQIIAGILEYVRDNQFGCVAFMSYGAFWETFAFLHFLSSWKLAAPMDGGSAAMYLFVWGLFTAGMFCSSVHRRLNRCMQTLFSTLAILFWLLALGNLVKHKGHDRAGEIILQVAGAEGMFVGALAIYMAMADMNDWPLFPMPKREKSVDC